MPVVRVKADTLDEENLRFAQAPLKQPLFLNSVPKSGSHLLRNIIRMFVPLEQQYKVQFIQWPNLQQHLQAFDREKSYLSWGHLLFSDASAIELAAVRKVLLVRDPYEWVLARARFFMSEEFSGNINHIKDGRLSVPSLLNLMIFGVYQKAPPLAEIYANNAAAWLGTGVYLVRYEDLLANLKSLDSGAADAYFRSLFEACGIDPVPADWRDRILVGSDRKQSGTARENLTGLNVEFPRELPEAQKQLVDFAAPGLRTLLGYS
jgi:hypothetical protein